MSIFKTFDKIKGLTRNSDKLMDKLLINGVVNFTTEFHLYNNRSYEGYIIVFDDDMQKNQFEIHHVTIQDLAEFDEGYKLDYTVQYEDRNWNRIAYHYANAHRGNWKLS